MNMRKCQKQTMRRRQRRRSLDVANRAHRANSPCSRPEAWSMWRGAQDAKVSPVDGWQCSDSGEALPE